MSNGPLKAVSGLINVALGRARGFRGLEYLMNVICLVAGNLRRLPPSPWRRVRYGNSASWIRVLADREPAGRRWLPIRKLAEYGNRSGRFCGVEPCVVLVVFMVVSFPCRLPGFGSPEQVSPRPGEFQHQSGHSRAGAFRSSKRGDAVDMRFDRICQVAAATGEAIELPKTVPHQLCMRISTPRFGAFPMSGYCFSLLCRSGGTE